MSHTCHAKLCDTACPPRFLMCGRHWAMVPSKLQRRVYATFRRGQCEDMRPSLEWHEAADAAIAAVALEEGCPFAKLRVIEARALLNLAPEMCPEGMREKLAEIDARKERQNDA